MTEMGVKVGRSDEVRVDGEALGLPRAVTVALYKPKGVVTTLMDPQRRPTIAQFVQGVRGGVKPVGRLDMDTDGLILLTNDGELASRLSHAKYAVEKEYIATLNGLAPDSAIERMRNGVVLDGRRTAPAKVEIIDRDEKKYRTVLAITLKEGRNRQIRRMAEIVGFPVTALRRVRIGHLRLKGMQPGEAIILGQKDVERLRKSVGL